MFSSDLTENELREKLGHVNVPCLLAISADDEYVPASVDSTLLSHRMADAMAVAPTKGAKSVILASGGHGVRNAEGQAQFISVSAVILRDAVTVTYTSLTMLYNIFSPVQNDNQKNTCTSKTGMTTQKKHLYLSRIFNTLRQPTTNNPKVQLVISFHPWIIPCTVWTGRRPWLPISWNGCHRGVDLDVPCWWR